MSQMISLNKIVTSLESGSRPAGGIKANTIGIPSIGAEHLNDQGKFNFNNVKYIPDSFFESQKKGIIKANDILIVKDGATTGKASFVDESFPFAEASLNEHVFRLAVDEKIAVPKYIFWYLFSGYGKMQIMSNFRGATIGGITKDFVNGVKLNLPPLEEQHRIVKILDLAQSLIEKRKQAIAYLDDYIKAVFLDMFGDPVSNPKGWEVVKLEHLLKFLTSGSRGWAKYFSTDGEYFLSIKNVGRDNRLNLNGVVYVNPPKNAEAKRTKVQKGDILFSITADLGRTIVVPQLEKNAFINQHLAILRLKEEVEPIYITYYLRSAGGQQQLTSLNKGSAKAGLNFNNIKSLNILIPPVQLQIKFASTVNKVELLREKMQTQLRELEDNFQALLQRAFIGG